MAPVLRRLARGGEHVHLGVEQEPRECALEQPHEAAQLESGCGVGLSGDGVHSLRERQGARPREVGALGDEPVRYREEDRRLVRGEDGERPSHLRCDACPAPGEPHPAAQREEQRPAEPLHQEAAAALLRFVGEEDLDAPRAPACHGRGIVPQKAGATFAAAEGPRSTGHGSPKAPPPDAPCGQVHDPPPPIARRPGPR